MGRFENSVAVITGGGSGIGEATAKQMASEGAKVVIVGRTAAKLENVANDINNNVGEQRAFTFPADVTNEDDVKNLVAYLEKEFGDVHFLLNNAGGSQHSNLQGTDVEHWKNVIDLNINSVFSVSKHVGKLMIDAAKENHNVNRSIVNVASLSGHKPGAMFPHYSAAKSAVINLTKATAFEYSRSGIRVNSISPGFIETPLTEDRVADERFEKLISRKTTMGRVGQPEEIASVATFLFSTEASYITGIDMLVDGGYMLT